MTCAQGFPLPVIQQLSKELQVFIKFEYLKFAGCLEDIRVFEHLTGFVQVIMKIDGILIPNVKVPILNRPWFRRHLQAS